ncbi:hypothetical protein DCAR_0934392 [Daucus carota subsp. sativus]|uniref:PHD-type zinc finger plants domain-containing protein n=1 Tax=Daucus carota subsp. sativus TaxID=79200 RepID=A0A175YAM5_DAUCS|nr:PREDICTED: uncharacterized protein LOC108192681 [Daucus carota subsp. sativus]WOH14865.1 hypothetical protein DCAR_0934392 [Daucus carota subsp. sativus]
MGDLDATVCCLCGDIGFPDKLFRCSKCHNRFQHSYCSNFYRESPEAIAECDWCQSAANTSKHGGSSKKAMASGLVITNRPSYSSGDKSKQQHEDDNKGKSPSPSPRTATRRYKLLKDVMC